MKKCIALLLLNYLSIQVFFSQNIAITDDDTYTADQSAMLDVKSLSKGMLVPRMTSAQRLLISNPATGLLVFDTNFGSFFFYNGTAWADLSAGGDVWSKTGSNVHLANSTDNVGIGTNTPFGKLEVKADATIGINDPIFQVVNDLGDTVFAVYKSGVRINVEDSPAKATGSKGGFAVGGFSPAKGGLTNEYLRVTPDSVRIYIEENNPAKGTGSKGGFAVGGFSPAKMTVSDYLSVNSDSINVSKSLYIPRMTTTERDNLGFVPSEALIIFNTTDKCMEIYENGVWSNIWCFQCAPAIIIQPLDQTICSGTTASFNVSATGTSLHYQWQQSNDGGTSWFDIADGGTSPIFSGTTTSALSLSNIQSGFVGVQFRCYVTASCDPVVYSNGAGLYFGNPTTTITAQPVDQTLSMNCTASFNVATSESGLNYQWQVSTDGGNNWNNISNGGTSPAYTGVTTTNLNILNAPSSMNGYKFKCVIDNPCGTGAISNIAVLSAVIPNANTAMNITQNSFLANWNAISGISNYFLDVSTTSDFSTFVPGYNNLNTAFSPNYNVVGLMPGITYYYRVRAAFPCGLSLNSNVIIVTTSL